MSFLFGQQRQLPQENADPIVLVVFGDEFYARYETLEGYSVVYDSNIGLFCYASIAQGQFISTGIPATETPPFGIPRHLQESSEVIKAKVNRKSTTFLPPTLIEEPSAGVFGPEKGLLRGRRVSSGNIRGLTILVNFQDLASQISQNDVSAMLNDLNYTAHGNVCSVRSYFRTVSSNNLDYTNLVVGPVTLSHNRDHYINNSLVLEALQLIQGIQIDGADIDFGQFDSKGELIIDALNILYAGEAVFNGELWPHNAAKEIRIGAYKTHFYMLSNLGLQPADLRIGTLCHENGHMLCRFPDMYDYGARGNEGDTIDSAGIGLYCLMGVGNYLDDERTPAPVCAYLRHLVRWHKTEVSLNDPGTYQVTQGDYETIYIFRTTNINEYFLVENRFRTGLDKFQPANGLAVYHCDFLGSNEFQQGTRERHYQCALLQADGRADLEILRNYGDKDDLYRKVEGIALTHNSSPSSILWDGSESGFTLSDISAPGKTITFTTGEGDQTNFTIASVNPVEAMRVGNLKAIKEPA